MLSQNKMHNWQENEIKELLIIRGSEVIRGQITGTVKDSVVYSRMTKLLAELGVHRSHMQVISKRKALRKQHLKYHDQKIRTGSDRVHWLLHDLCHRALHNPPMLSPSKRQRSPSPTPATADSTPSPSPSPPAAPPPPPAATANEQIREVRVSLWDDQESNQHLEADDDEEELSPPEQLQTINTSEFIRTLHRGFQCGTKTYTVPSRKRRATVMDQVSTLVSATVAQLREMDAAIQAQEDARLQRLMTHEREMQNSLMSQLVLMNERISRENHERNLELVDRILSRFPSSSSNH